MLSIMTFLTSLAFAGDWTNNKGLTNHGAVYNSFESSSVGLTLFITAFCFDEFDDSMSVLITVMLGHPLHQYTVERPKRSSALGDNFMYIWSLSGRLQIDLYHYIKRSAALPSYKLDEVAKHYLSGSLKGYAKKGKNLVLQLGGAVRDLRPGRALCLLDETGESMTDKMVIEAVTGSLYLRVIDEAGGDGGLALPGGPRRGTGRGRPRLCAAMGRGQGRH